MNDIYLYEDVPVLKNKFGIKDEKTLDLVEAEQSRASMIRNLYFLKERKIFVLTADVENRGYLDTLKEIAEQKKDCGVKVFMDKKA